MSSTTEILAKFQEFSSKCEKINDPNYGKFNIRFSAIEVWNSVNENLRHSTKAKLFKKTLFAQILNSYQNAP